MTRVNPNSFGMGIEDTFGYRFVRTSLVLLNGLVLLRLLSLLLHLNHEIDSTFIFLIILISANFACAVMAALREYRPAVILTGSVTLIMFLSLIFTTKESKGVNVFLLILLAVSVQSLIFSEMLKEKQVFLLRRQRFIDNLNRNGTFRTEDGRRLAAVVVTVPSQIGNSSRLTSGAVFTLDPELSNELAKDPPPPYFSASNVPPPKYEDAVQLDATILPGSSNNNNNDTSVSSELQTTSQDNEDSSSSNVQSTSSQSSNTTTTTTTTTSSSSPSSSPSTTLSSPTSPSSPLTTSIPIVDNQTTSTLSTNNSNPSD